MEFKILIVLIAFAAFWFVVLYNRFVKKKNRLEEAWSGIDVQLKRRANLIPNLVETVKGYLRHEQSTLDAVTRLRTGSAAPDSIAERSVEESKVSSALHRLLAVAEGYPELKADSGFLQLQGQLHEIEDQIQYARRYYNGAARDWNIMVEAFPSNLVAGVFGFVQADFFEIDTSEERAVPKVSF